MELLIVFGVVILLVTVPAIIGCLALYYVFPQYIIKLTFAYQRYQLGMAVKYIRDEKSALCYGEMNSFQEDKPTLVFLHGFTSSSNQWLGTFKYLPKDRHVLALDLPGHGSSSLPEDFSVESLSCSLCHFLDSVGLKDKKIHLIGNSLGGTICGMFAAYHPDRVEKVTLICPAMDTPVDTDFSTHLKKAEEMSLDKASDIDYRLLPQDVPSMKKMLLSSVYYKEKVNFPDQICQGILNLSLERNEYFAGLVKIISTRKNLGLLAGFAPNMTMPSQIIWGKEDELLSSSGAHYLKPLLPDCRHVNILENCGHSFYIDKPQTFCETLLSFVEEDIKKED